MHPILFTIGPITIYSYGVMLAVAVLVCTYLFSLDANRYNISKDDAYDLVFWTIVGGLIAARIFYVFIAWDYFSQNLWEIPMLQKGGLAWQGGFIGGLLAGIIFVRRRKLSVRPVLDLSAPYIALGQSIGRIGCFFNGCCYGKPVAWGIYYPVHHARLYPTQLFETAGLFLIFVILKIFQAKPHHEGFIFVLYLLLAAVERFVVEFYRGDTIPMAGGLTLAQYVAMGVFAAGLIYLVVVNKVKQSK